MGINTIGRGQQRAVFLDRDGVLNQAVVRDGKPYPPACPANLRVLPGTLGALTSLREEGFLLYVVTNQPDVARGVQQRAIVEAMHSALRHELPLNGFYVCYHDDPDACECRKPKPGLLAAAAREHRICLPASYMIGDRWRDVEAGQRAGCRTVWINRNYSEPGPTTPADATVRSLQDAVVWILQESRKKRCTI